MRWQDSGFNTEDCSLLGNLLFRNLKADKIAPRISCNEFTLQLILILKTASEKPFDIDQPLRIFLPFSVAIVFSHERIWTVENDLTLHGMENHTLLWQVVGKGTLSRNASRSANSWSELEMEVLIWRVPKAQLNESSAVAVESIFSLPLLFKMVPNYFTFV